MTKALSDDRRFRQLIIVMGDVGDALEEIMVSFGVMRWNPAPGEGARGIRDRQRPDVAKGATDPLTSESLTWGKRMLIDKSQGRPRGNDRPHQFGC